mgnify:CR=1 FL=1
MGAALRGLYVAADPEKLDIDDSVRKSVSGQFVRLADGYTHYELGGPAHGEIVVLAAGISVPYYIWDPTFKAYSPMLDSGCCGTTTTAADTPTVRTSRTRTTPLSGS